MTTLHHPRTLRAHIGPGRSAAKDTEVVLVDGERSKREHIVFGHRLTRLDLDAIIDAAWEFVAALAEPAGLRNRPHLAHPEVILAVASGRGAARHRESARRAST